jgi:hypothetical protein
LAGAGYAVAVYHFYRRADYLHAEFTGNRFYLPDILMPVNDQLQMLS